MDLRELRRSVELESQADLLAMSYRFGEAAAYMGEANKIRQREFGKFDPNELRVRTHEALAEIFPSSP